MTTFNTGLFGQSYSLQRDDAVNKRWLARHLNKIGNRKLRELLLTLNGVAPGQAALETYSRVAHSTTELGGVREIETETLVDRDTTAADVTEINDELLSFVSSPTYPVDKATLA